MPFLQFIECSCKIVAQQLGRFLRRRKLSREKSSARPTLGRAFLKRQIFAPQPLAAHLIFWPVMLAGLALDLWSKKAVFEWLRNRADLSFSLIDGFLQLVMAQNAGAAFGIASGQRWLLVAVSGLALIVILTVFLFSGTGKKVVYVALGLFAAGIFGNLYDRIFNNGLVRDFIDVYYRRYHWPAFNVADSMLCIAVGLLLISSFRAHKHCPTGRSS